MKFAFSLIKYFPFGGLQRDFTRIARECAARGHQIDVYTPDWQGAVPRGLNLRVLKPRGFSMHSKAADIIEQVATC